MKIPIIPKPLLQQDDCAPDSFEYFEKAFLEMFNIEFDKWVRDSKKIPLEMGCDCEKDGILVRWVCDDPYYQVWRTSEAPKIV